MALQVVAFAQSDECSSQQSDHEVGKKDQQRGGSMRDVQMLARHPSLTMTQRYDEVSGDACRKVVG